MTGIPASGPMSPSPSTLVPSVTTAMVFALLVYWYTREGSSLIGLAGFGHSGSVPDSEIVDIPDAALGGRLHLALVERVEPHCVLCRLLSLFDQFILGYCHFLQFLLSSQFERHDVP